MGIIFTFLIGLFMAFEPITDNDWFWHYVVGNVIDKTHQIPTHELFGWYKDYAWTAHEWLTEFCMYKLGPIGDIAIMLIIFLVLYFLMAKMLKVKFNKLFDFKLIYLLMMTVFFKVTGPRPYILSLVFMAYLVYVVFNYLDDNKKFNKLIYTIPLLQIVWVNFHGGSSSLPYILIVGILLCDLFVKFFKFKESRWTDFKLTKDKIKTLFIVLGLTIVASCINPFGYKMLLYPFTNMADTSMLENITEWASANFHGFFGMYLFVIVAFPLFNLILNKNKMKLHEIGFQLVFLFMAMRSQRFIGMYAIYSMWTLGKYFFVTDEMYDTLKKPFKKFEKVITVCFCMLLVFGCVLVAYKQVHSFASFVNTNVIDNDGFYSDEAVKQIIKLKPKRLYNDYSQGGYLLYKLNEYNALDDVKIFAYGLGDVFSQEILPDSRSIENLTDNTRELIEKYNFDVMLTTKNKPLHYFLDEMKEYSLYYSDDMCYIYIKVM
jgi:hypothetical protein